MNVFKRLLLYRKWSPLYSHSRYLHYLAREKMRTAEQLARMADVEIRNLKAGELLLYDEDRKKMVNKLPEWKQSPRNE